MSDDADAWVALILAVVGLSAVYFLPGQERRHRLRARSMRRCAQDAELAAAMKHGGER